MVKVLFLGVHRCVSKFIYELGTFRRFFLFLVFGVFFFSLQKDPKHSHGGPISEEQGIQVEEGKGTDSPHLSVKKRGKTFRVPKQVEEVDIPHQKSQKKERGTIVSALKVLWEQSFITLCVLQGMRLAEKLAGEKTKETCIRFGVKKAIYEWEMQNPFGLILIAFAGRSIGLSLLTVPGGLCGKLLGEHFVEKDFNWLGLGLSMCLFFCFHLIRLGEGLANITGKKSPEVRIVFKELGLRYARLPDDPIAIVENIMNLIFNRFLYGLLS